MSEQQPTEMSRASIAPAYDRRDLLKRALAVGAAVPAVDLLATSAGWRAMVSAQEGGTIVVALDALYAPPDPGIAPSFTQWFINQNICESLIEFNVTPEGEESFIPRLAESYESSDDGSVWTFNLRQGVKFHDGTDFNAEAVAYSHQRLMDLSHPGYLETFVQIGDPLNSLIDSIETPDEFTVVFKLTPSASGDFLKWESKLKVVSPAAVEEYGVDYGSHLIATGPFKLTRFDFAGNRVEAERFADYWEEGVPKLDRIIWNIVAEPATRLAQVQTGEADVITAVPTEFVSRLEGDQNISVDALQTPGFNGLEFYYSLPPFDDVRVRQAVAHALDRTAMTQLLYGELWTPAINNRWPGLQGWTDESPFPYDPDQARSLLAEAGYEDGLEVSLMMPSSAAANPAGQRWGEVIQEQLAQVGVTVNLNVMESAAYWAQTAEPQPNTMFYMSRQSWVGDVVREWLNFWTDEGPRTMRDIPPYPGMEELVQQWSEAADPAARDEAVNAMWELLDTEVPYIAIALGSWITASRADLQNITSYPIGEWLSFREASRG